MVKLTRQVVDAVTIRTKDYIIWDDTLPGFGLRVFTSGRRSYVIQCRAFGRSRRCTIGPHGLWTADQARHEAKAKLGKIRRGEHLAPEGSFTSDGITVGELCTLYLKDLAAGLIKGRNGHPKKPTTIASDIGRIHRHIIPLLGARVVNDVTKADINQVLADVMAGKTRVTVQTKTLRHRVVVRGGAGAASRTVGLLSSIFSYAVGVGMIHTNPAHGVRRPKDGVRNRRLNEDEYRELGAILRRAAEIQKYRVAVDIIRLLALTGCRRSEMVGLKWSEADTDWSCLRLADSKGGASVRPIGLPVVEYLEARRKNRVGTHVFPGSRKHNTFGSFPKHWGQIVRNTALSDVTPHVLRHSFASIANDLGFTEVTIAALVGHAMGSTTSKYVHASNPMLIMAADTVSGYIQGLLDGMELKQTTHSLDRTWRKAALERFLGEVARDKDTIADTDASVAV